MKHFAFVEDGWVISAGSAPAVPAGAIELAEPLKDTQYRFTDEGLVRCEAPTLMHTKGADGTWVISDEALWGEARRERNALLRETDILVLRSLETGGAPSEALTTYRQALRDLPQSTASPSEIRWPVQPEELL